MFARLLSPTYYSSSATLASFSRYSKVFVCYLTVVTGDFFDRPTFHSDLQHFLLKMVSTLVNKFLKQYLITFHLSTGSKSVGTRRKRQEGRQRQKEEV